MIVIEGMDNSGKSTLAQYLAQGLGLSIQESEGPPQSRVEINERVRRYNGYIKTLFVRHPCISNPIYDKIRPEAEQCFIDQELIDQFYQRNSIYIYCDPLERGLQGHLEKGHDSAAHLVGIRKWYPVLLGHYREWAIEHAHIIYRIGDNMSQIKRWLNGYR